MISSSTGQARAKSALEVKGTKAPLWATLLGTFFYAGHGKPGPGTWGSVATVLLWRGFGGMLAPGWQMPAAIASAAVVTAIGIPAATRVAREAGREDPSHVVIDEVAGQMIALIGAPLGWKSLLAGLILFRACDIVKPPPLRRLERLPEGLGIMMDDVGAGLYALAIMQALVHYGILK
jgi:phosphatidylglycerophosphatase A